MLLIEEIVDKWTFLSEKVDGQNEMDLPSEETHKFHTIGYT